MASIPLKPQYGPTLGRLLEPRWRSAAPLVRSLAIAALCGLLLLVGGAVLALLPASYSHGGPLPFSFEYKGLYRTAPDPGGYVRVARSAGGLLSDSYAVAPLRLGAYSGSVTGELPLFASGYALALASRLPHLRLEGEGKTRISSTLGGYEVLYSTTLHARKLYGRDVMLLPERPGARRGVVIEMLSSQPATISKPVASSGVLERPLKTFAFG
ncbi:MAG TPA: hypothetical protein VK672_07410 [Solirubrobacteraceae bacterium]|jgi:hypothetical protein|nr:hypothetical protein [Solirubrobacteraceae bacterium]